MAFLLGIPGMFLSIFTSLSLVNWLVIIVLFSVWFYRHQTRDFGIFEKMGIFAVKPNFLFGNSTKLMLGQVGFLDLHQQLYETYKKHGIACYYEATEPVIYVTDPELMKKIQITDFEHFVDMGFMNINIMNVPDNSFGLANSTGDEWRHFRAAVTPAFRLKHMRNISSHLNAAAVRTINHAAKLGTDNKEVDFAKLTGFFTIDCIASSVMSIELDVFNNQECEFVKMGNALIASELRFVIAMSMPELAAKFGMCIFNPKSVTFFKKLTKKMIAERSTQANPPHDILGIMLKARENKLEGEDTSGHSISDDRIAETCMQFFLDGHTTVAMMLKMTCYFLALNQDIQERAIEEVDEFYNKHGGNINKDNISELKFLEQIQEESIRIANFPLAARTTTKPWQVPGKPGAVIPVGTRVICNFGGLQTDSDYFPDPLVFDPDRFSPENKKTFVPMTYQPFGAGPRMCVGAQIAKLEIQIFLFNMLKRFKLLPGETTKYPIKWKTLGFMDPEGDVKLRLVERN